MVFTDECWPYWSSLASLCGGEEGTSVREFYLVLVSSKNRKEEDDGCLCYRKMVLA
jgi:hypothetical protein